MELHYKTADYTGDISTFPYDIIDIASSHWEIDEDDFTIEEINEFRYDITLNTLKELIENGAIKTLENEKYQIIPNYCPKDVLKEKNYNLYKEIEDWSDDDYDYEPFTFEKVRERFRKFTNEDFKLALKLKMIEIIRPPKTC